jgi:hypothetical protein
MDLDNILAQLRREWNRLGRAIEALQSDEVPKRRGRKPAALAVVEAGPKNGRRRRHMSAAARRKISEMMKKRWAERKRKLGAA